MAKIATLTTTTVNSLKSSTALLDTTPSVPTTPDYMTSLTTLLESRHSTRAFLSTPVPTSILHTALSAAQHAPSNSNVQNWRLYLVSGQSLGDLKAALTLAASEASPKIPPLPPKYSHFRSELGHKVYGEGYGIPRSDLAGKIAKERRNYSFFDAPVAGIVCMDKSLSRVDALSVGMWLQSFLLGLTAQGLSSCIEVSVAGYMDIIADVLGLGDDMEVLCGVAIGYEDQGEKINGIRSGRMDWRECVVERA